MDYSLLINRKIIDVLIGDTQVFDTYRLPYMSGPDLCSLCTAFGLSKTYTWGGGNKSRWEYMQDLLNYLRRKSPDLINVGIVIGETAYNEIGFEERDAIEKLTKIFKKVQGGSLVLFHEKAGELTDMKKLY